MYSNCYPERNFDLLEIFDMISGTSAGSMLSVLIHLGYDLEKIK